MSSSGLARASEQAMEPSEIMRVPCSELEVVAVESPKRSRSAEIDQVAGLVGEARLAVRRAVPMTLYSPSLTSNPQKAVNAE